MGYIVRMPQMGMEMEQGEVVSWEYDEGEAVAADEILVVVESEKATNEVEAREEGVLRRIVVDEGGTVEPGTPIGIVAGPEEDISEYEAEIEGAPAASADAGDDAAAGAATAAAGPDSASAGTAPGTAAPSSDGRGASAEEVRATPGARDLASEEGVDLTALDGTGPQGVVTEDDVKDAAAASDDGAGAGAADATEVRATPGARQRAEEEGVDLTAVEGTGPQGVVTEDDVEEAAGAAAGPATDGTSAKEVRASPGARRLASEEGVDLTALDGTGPHGVIIEDDVRAALEAGGAAAEPAGDRETTRTVREVRELSGIQQTVSDRLSESYRNAVHVTNKRQFDASTLQSVASAADAAGLDVSLTDLLVAAVGAELAARPAFNALFEDGEHRLIEEVNVGVAVDVEAGLVTPVVPGVTEKSVEEIATVRGELTERALAGEFTSDDLAGGTFTITNLGPFGVDSFDPVINPPEVAILGVGRVREDDTMTLSLSFDHRVLNGADAARFLDGLVGRLTDTMELLDAFETDLARHEDVAVSVTARSGGT